MRSTYVPWKQRIRDYSLRPEEVLGFSGRWKSLEQAAKAMKKIRRYYLYEDELILLELLSMNPPKTPTEIGVILGTSRQGARWQQQSLFDVIAAYGWWLRNEAYILKLVRTRLSPLHAEILIPIIHRQRQRITAKRLSVTRWCVQKKIDDIIRLLPNDFTKFLQSLRLAYIPRSRSR
jgi:hypothetical protein